MSKYAYIESATGTVWAAGDKLYSAANVALSTGFPVDYRRDDAPDGIQPKGSGLAHFHKWSGTSYEICWVLADLKAAKNEIINERTRQIIAEGVTYDGRQFPLDLPDQSTWHGIFNAVAAGVASYPIKVMDKLDEPYYLADAPAFQTMYFTGFGSVGAILESGRVIKAQVNACLTKEEIDAVVDPR